MTGPVPADEVAGLFADWVSDNRLDAVVMPYAPVGPAADALAPLVADGRITRHPARLRRGMLASRRRRVLQVQGKPSPTSSRVSASPPRPDHSAAIP